MPSNLILAFAVGLAAGSPPAAQDMAAHPAAAASAPAASAAPSRADMDAAGVAFRAEVDAMNLEVRAAVQASGSNRRRALGRVDDILARYQPGFESFAIKLEAWFGEQATAATTAEERASIIETGAANVAQVRGVTTQVRTSLAEQMRRAAPERPNMSSGM